jgi:hypothetical protein
MQPLRLQVPNDKFPAVDLIVGALYLNVESE